MKYLISALFISLFLFSASIVHASSPTPTTSPSPSSSTQPTLDSVSLKMDYTFLSFMHTLDCVIGGKPLLNKPCFSFAPLGSLPISTTTAQTNGGLIGFTTGIIGGLLSTPPIHAQQYVADISSSFGLIPRANAQASTNIGGAGGQVVSGVYNLWQVSRNMSYILMSIIFIVIGLMVMFRQRINPQTVITVQNALPGLVIGLVLITLSYFFASVLVDVGFVAVYLIGFYFNQTQPAGTPDVTQGLVENENLFSLFSFFVNASNNIDLAGTLNPILSQIQGSAAVVLDVMIRLVACEYSTQLSGPLAALPFVGGFIPVGACVTASQAAISNRGAFVGNIAWLAIFVILLYTLLQIVLKLLNNYINILFLTLSAPFQFLAASLPGQQGAASAWARNMLCNVLAFPGIFGVFYFSAYILSQGNPDIGRLYSIQVGMSSTSQALPLFANIDSDLIRYLIGFGVLLAAPGIPDIICASIGKMGKTGDIIGGHIKSNIGAGQKQTEKMMKQGQVAAGTGIGAVRAVRGFF